MAINILIFGQLTEITGNGHIEMEHMADTNSLLAALHAAYPALKEATFMLAVDKRTVSENTALPQSCTVALLPAFSGG
jgi:sulfur-carrier protein